MIRVFEAFAGYGSTCFALKELGVSYELVGFSEIDKYAIQCFQQNHRGYNYGDISKINWGEVPNFDLLSGGFPCQTFSISGGLQGELDKRGQLGLELTKILMEKQPKYFLFENVKGFMSKRFNETRTKFIYSWRDAGYDVYYKILNTKDFGIPQNRERVWFVGIRKDIKQSFVFPECMELKLKLKDILEQEVDLKYFLKQEQNKRFSLCLKNQNKKQNNFNSKSNLVKQSKCIELTKKQKQGNRVYSIEGMCPTLCGNGGGLGAKTGLFLVGGIKETNSIRRLTPRECFRLQGFLNDQINLGGISNSQLYKLAGNGQSINVVKLILKGIL